MTRAWQHSKKWAIQWLEASGAKALLRWVFVLALTVPPAAAQTYTVLHNFTGGADGKYPEAGVISDAAGNLYGTAYQGGASNRGVVFKIDATGTETVLYSFTGSPDGAWPYAVLVRDSQGNLYGTTAKGGVTEQACPNGCGVVFKLDVTGTETVLNRFSGRNGAHPYEGLIVDPAGNLFGTSLEGGIGPLGVCDIYFRGCGVAFMMDSAGKETVLHPFTGGNDGGQPQSGLVQDSAGNLYGTTSLGGASNAGVVYKLDNSGKETVLYNFTGGADGATPMGTLGLDSTGNLYGTTYSGGAGACSSSGCGVVFRLDTTGKETVLYSFTGGADGALPASGVILDSAGSLYGTTYLGGHTSDGICAPSGCGVLFKLDMTGRQTILHTFTNTDGRYPKGLIQDQAGNLYGTATSGGTSNFGVVFKLKP